jgi:hypothetical protein
LTGLNTVILFYDVAGGWAGSATQAANQFHYTVYDKDSDTVFDDDVTATPHDQISADAITILGLMSPTAKASLLVDIDGDGTTDHYAGYIYWDAINNDNDTVGKFMFLDLNAGQASIANIAMKESGEDLVGDADFHDAMFNQDATSEDFDMEQFSPNALNAAVDLQAGLAAPTDAANFLMYPRFYILGSGDATWWMFWNSTDGLPGTLHLDWYDTEEHTASSNITIDDEWEVISVEDLLPTGIWPAATYPKEGYLILTWPTNTAALRAMETLGWTYLQAFGASSEAWVALSEMFRDVN